MRPLLLAAALVTGMLTACAGPQRAEHKNLCPGSQTRCTTDEICSWDSTRSCFVCICREPEAGPQKPDWVPDHTPPSPRG
ncbi:MAG: hypothetical protein U0229_04810 [Anaeromyxobacter sp.]